MRSSVPACARSLGAVSSQRGPKVGISFNTGATVQAVVTETMPARPLAELHGRRGATLVLTQQAVRLGSGREFGSIPLGEVSSCHYEGTRAANVAHVFGIAASVFLSLSILLLFTSGDDDWLGMIAFWTPLAIVAFAIGFALTPKRFVVRSRGGGRLGLRVARAQDEDVRSFVEAIERAKSDDKGPAATAAPTFQAYVRRR